MGWPVNHSHSAVYQNRLEKVGEGRGISVWSKLEQVMPYQYRLEKVGEDWGISV